MRGLMANRGKRAKYTEEQLREAVSGAESISEVMRRLNSRSSSIVVKIKEFRIDVSHIMGNKWAKGKSCVSDHRIVASIDPDSIFIENSSASKSLVRSILMKQGRGVKCETCGIESWNGQPITFEMDHINGLRMDHRLENLRFLCPNCHSQTPTFRNKQGRRQYDSTNTISLEESFIVRNLPKFSSIHMFIQANGINRTKSAYQKIYDAMHKHQLVLSPRMCSRCNTSIARNRRRTCAKCVVQSDIPRKGDVRCVDCEKEISSQSTRCKSCAAKLRPSKIDWPTHSELVAMVESSSWLAVGKALGVSDNAVRKRLKTHKE
jgi:Zn finger protein HypA/HybF involved in hydrogenase expression